MVETIPIWRPPFWQLLWRGLAWLYALAARRTEAPGCGADEARATPALRNAETALDRYGNSILRLTYSYLHNLSDAEDILQDTLLKYIQAAPAFESDGHEKAWLLTVAANLSKNKLQYLRLRQTDELDETLAAQEREDLRYVWEAVRQLPGNYREVIYLFYQEGYSTKEISTILRRSKLYVCPVCGNIIHSMGSVPVSCCGIGLPPLEPEEPDADHAVTWERMENEFYITSVHPMAKDHFISFAAYCTEDRFELVKLYPEGEMQASFQNRGRGMLLWYCNRHGLFAQTIGGKK